MEIRSSGNYIWNLRDVLGQGATGAVYKGRDKKTGNEVAIKATNHLGMLRPPDVRKREFEVLNRLDHENIVRIYASESELRSQNEIIAMELCTGGSLYTLLEHPANAYGFSEKDCTDIIRDVVAGMEHLRQQGIVHRDLKPGNIMRVFNEDGTCSYKLTDFGAARELEHSTEQFMSVYGTEEYLHPDLYERGVLRKSSGKTFGANVDLWSIGITVYHLATGKLPFRPHGGRQNKDMMYHITTTKKSGVISGVQKTGSVDIEWSDKLPEHTQLSRGFQHLLTPILAGVLESEPTKMMSFNDFFKSIQDLVSRKVVEVFHVQSNSFHPIYIEPKAKFEKFQELIAEETKLLPDQQRIYVNGELFKPSQTFEASMFPPSSRENPVVLAGGDFVPPAALIRRKIPSVAKLAEEWTLEADAAAAKIIANCAYSCKYSTKYYTDVINAMCCSFDVVIKSCKSELLEFSVDCGEIEGRRDAASVMTKLWCHSQEHVICLLEDLISSVHLTDGDKLSAQQELTTIHRSIQKKLQSNQELDKLKNFTLNLKTLKCKVVNDDFWFPSYFNFNQNAAEKSLYPLVSNTTTKIEEIYNRYRKDKHSRRLSFPEEQNHTYDRKRLVMLSDKVVHTTKECFSQRVSLYEEFTKLIINIYREQNEAYRLKGQIKDLALADEAHLKSLATFQRDCPERYQRILGILKQSMARSPSLSVGTDTPSLSLPTNGVTKEELMSENFFKEMETQMTLLCNTSKISSQTAKDNTNQLKHLAASFTEFYELLHDTGAKTLDELRILQENLAADGSTTQIPVE